MIEVRNLSKNYKNFKLENVSFSLKSGNIVGLIGANGAGKSTILRIMVGLVKKDSGKVLANGQMVTNLGERYRVGFVSQNLDIYSGQKMSSVSNFVKDIYSDIWDNELYEYYLFDRFNLKDDKKIKELSTGMRVKFFLAIELAKNPECLLLDEVTSGLDPLIRDEVLDILSQIAKNNNIPIVLSSHITEDLEKIADYIVYLDSGHVLLEDTVKNIKQNYYKIDSKMLETISDKNKAIILERGIRQHNYYIYNVNLLIGNEKVGDSAMLSDVLPFLRKE